MSELSSDVMRRAIRALTHGVYVLSVRHDQDDFLIVSLAMQCSVEPPRIAMAIAHGARILPALTTVNSGVLGILGETQKAAVRRYGAPGGVRHPPADARRTAAQHVIPPEAQFWMEFSVVSVSPVGDHTLVIATVTGAGVAATETVSDAADDSAPFVPMTLAGSNFPYAG